MNEKKIQKEKVTTRKNNTALNIVIILLLATIIVSAVIGLYAWAKYRSAMGGVAEAEVAKWHFELKEGTTDSGKTLLALTRKDENTTVAKGKVAPGTYGELPIIIDTTKTEVSLVYDLAVTITNFPQNMILENLDGQVITPEVSGDGTGDNPRVATITISNYVPYNTDDSNRLHNETITWNWPYETGTKESEINANDKIDTQDAGKEISVSISVTGTQVMEEPRLADLVRVGDYVNYNAASGEGAGKRYTPDESLTGTADGINTFSSSDTMKWKVMSIDKTTGIVELMAENPTANTVKLYGKIGYKNAETVLNKVGEVYGYGEGAAGGRSITVEDVNKLENYTPTDDTTTSYTYTSGTFIMDNGTEVTEVTATTANSITISYTASTTEKSTKKYYFYTTENFSGKSFWLASRCLDLRSSVCIFLMRHVDSSYVVGGSLFFSFGGEADAARAVLPVVSLKSNIQTSGQDKSGAWNLRSCQVQCVNFLYLSFKEVI